MRPGHFTEVYKNRISFANVKMFQLATLRKQNQGIGINGWACVGVHHKGKQLIPLNMCIIEYRILMCAVLCCVLLTESNCCSVCGYFFCNSYGIPVYYINEGVYWVMYRVHTHTHLHTLECAFIYWIIIESIFSFFHIQLNFMAT